MAGAGMLPPKTDWRWDNMPGLNWYGVVQGSLIAGLFFYLYAPILPQLAADWWDDPNYSHGFLIPCLSAYCVWQKRQQLAQAASGPSQWGLPVLLLGLCMVFLGNIGAELFLMRASMIVVLAGLVLYHGGRKRLQVLAFPLAFLLFMVPLPAIVLNALTFPLQLLATRLSTMALQGIGLPVYREGNIIFLPYGTLEVVEACSGIRSLMSLTALAAVVAYMTHRTVWKRSVLVVSAVPMALVANAFRIWGTGVLAHLYGMRVADGFYHTFAGWLVFVVAFALLGVEALLLSRCKRQRVDAAPEEL